LSLPYFVGRSLSISLIIQMIYTWNSIDSAPSRPVSSAKTTSTADLLDAPPGAQRLLVLSIQYVPDTPNHINTVHAVDIHPSANLHFFVPST